VLSIEASKEERRQEGRELKVVFDGKPKETIVYHDATGASPFDEWVSGLRDRQTVARIQKRLIRLRAGNPGDYKAVATGVYELRLDFGPGYRIYFGFSGQQIVLLLCGGDKSTQATDIANAVTYWEDFQEREGQ
jgi:putative addiction module killer protein